MLSNITPEALDEMGPEDIARLDVSTLHRLAEEQTAIEATNKARRKVLNEGLEARYIADAKSKLASMRKDTGTADIEDGGYTVKAVIPKKVDWDSDKIASAMAGMNADLARTVIKTSYSITETMWNTLDEATKAMLMPARTVKPGPTKVTIAEKE